MYSTGTVIDDQFQIVDHLGVGGMGNVYRALDSASDRTVALKILSVDLAHDSEWRSRFLREGKVLSRLDHKNLVRVFRLGVWQGLPYIAMEYLPGKSLRREIEEHGKLSWQRALNIAIQICEGMECAHARRVIHRDIKPENIMLMLELPSQAESSQAVDSIKILDFGLARIAGTDTTRSQGLTRTGTIIGSVHYMSPEQCLGRKADYRADVYSLGCLLYEMVSGKVPFDADNGISLMHKHVSEEAPKVGALVNDASFPASMEAVIEKAMSKNPTLRYQSMSDMRLDLQRIQLGDFAALSVAKAGRSGRGLRQFALPALSLTCFVVLAGAGSWLLSDQGQIALFWLTNKSASPDEIVQRAIVRADSFDKEGNRSLAVSLLHEVERSVLAYKVNAVESAKLSVRLSELSRNQGNQSASVVQAEKAILDLTAVFDARADGVLSREEIRIAVKALKLLIADGKSYPFEYDLFVQEHAAQYKSTNLLLPTYRLSKVEESMLVLSRAVDRARAGGDKSGSTDTLHRALVDVQSGAAESLDDPLFNAYLNARRDSGGTDGVQPER